MYIVCIYISGFIEITKEKGRWAKHSGIDDVFDHKRNCCDLLQTSIALRTLTWQKCWVGGDRKMSHSLPPYTGKTQGNKAMIWVKRCFESLVISSDEPKGLNMGILFGIFWCFWRLQMSLFFTFFTAFLNKAIGDLRLQKLNSWTQMAWRGAF